MPILAVPNWSIGRERTVLRLAFDYLANASVRVHYAEPDIDHNRTVTGFSGEPTAVKETLLGLARILLPAINLSRHTGVHPRIGALDVCPILPMPEPTEVEELSLFIDSIAEELATEFEIPVFMYEKSARPGHIEKLPPLRRGGFGGLLDKELHPDFGPNQVHPHLGATVLGWRDPLIALNINFPAEPSMDALAIVAQIAATIRYKRREGDSRFIGVRALGLELTAQGIAQVSMNITKPDLMSADEVIRYVYESAGKLGLSGGYPQLIGVIRDVDVERSVEIPARIEQVVPTRLAQEWKSDWPAQGS